MVQHVCVLNKCLCKQIFTVKLGFYNTLVDNAVSEWTDFNTDDWQQHQYSCSVHGYRSSLRKNLVQHRWYNVLLTFWGVCESMRLYSFCYNFVCQECLAVDSLKNSERTKWFWIKHITHEIGCTFFFVIRFSVDVISSAFKVKHHQLCLFTRKHLKFLEQWINDLNYISKYFLTSKMLCQVGP